MNRQKIARELVKLARELEGESRMAAFKPLMRGDNRKLLNSALKGLDRVRSQIKSATGRSPEAKDMLSKVDVAKAAIESYMGRFA